MVVENILEILRCPRSGNKLTFENNQLISQDGSIYPIDDGIIDFVVDTHPGNQKVEKGYNAVAGWKYDKWVKSQFLMKFLWGVDMSMAPSATDFADEYNEGIILDVPCGTGAFENDLYKMNPEADFIAVDYTMEMIRHKKIKCEKMGVDNVTFIRADVSRLPFIDSSLDACLTLNGFHVFPNPSNAAAEIGRCMKQNASVKASVICSQERKISDIAMKYLMIPRGIFTNALLFSDYKYFFEASGFNNCNTISRLGSLTIFEVIKDA